MTPDEYIGFVSFHPPHRIVGYVNEEGATIPGETCFIIEDRLTLYTTLTFTPEAYQIIFDGLDRSGWWWVPTPRGGRSYQPPYMLLPSFLNANPWARNWADEMGIPSPDDSLF